MGVISKWLGRASGLAALGIFTLTATAAGADPSADSRLIFDPGALDHSRLGSDRDSARSPAAKPVDQPLPQAVGETWMPNTFNLPSFENGSMVNGTLAAGLSSAKSRSDPAGANLFEQRVTLGTVSIGLETETSIKPRSLSGDGDKDPERDTILDDPKRQRGFLPFIGLSAKSRLQ